MNRVQATPFEAALPAARAADQKFCHACGQLLHFSASGCPGCGAAQAAVPGWNVRAAEPYPHAPAAESPLAHKHVFCHGCGRQIHETAPNCPSCGARQRSTDAVSPSGPNRNVAAVLALFLGGLGAHKFYLGKVFQGLLYLLFFWTFIPAVIGFIEGVFYLTLSEQEFADRYR